MMPVLPDLWIHDVPSIKNFRVLSCPEIPDSLVYRSATLSNLIESDLPNLSHYISVIIDISSPPEILKQGSIGVAESALRDHGITRIEAPIFNELEYSPENIAKRHSLYQFGTAGFIDAYRGILDHFGHTLNLVFHQLARK